MIIFVCIKLTQEFFTFCLTAGGRSILLGGRFQDHVYISQVVNTGPDTGYLNMHILIIAELFFYGFIRKKSKNSTFLRNRCKLQSLYDFM